MYIHWDLFSLHKAGNAGSDYEDACWPSSRSDEASGSCFRCAMSDGATEASFSGLWARTLVEAYGTGKLTQHVSSEKPEEFIELAVLRELQYSWLEEVGNRSLPWYAEEKIRHGAFSSLLGLHFCEDSSVGCWSAIAVGDSCLFQLRKEHVIASFPLTQLEEFNSRPLLVPSDPIDNDRLPEYVRTTRGSWEKADSFLLMTDALAHWFIGARGQGSDPGKAVENLLAVDQARSFEEWVAQLRSSGKLRNDDVTLLRIDMIG
jgi:hypothetical protein